MNELPTYTVWHPSPEQGGSVVSVHLSRGSCQSAPAAGFEFFHAVLVAAGIRATLTAWGVEPFFTSYFTRTRWEEAWNARLLVAETVDVPEYSAADGIPIFAVPELQSESAASLPVRVLADFADTDAAESCRAAIEDRTASAKWNELHYELVLLRYVASGHRQLLVDVATVERPRLDEVIGAAAEVIAICEQHGGHTHATAA